MPYIAFLAFLLAGGSAGWFAAHSFDSGLAGLLIGAAIGTAIALAVALWLQRRR